MAKIKVYDGTNWVELAPTASPTFSGTVNVSGATLKVDTIQAPTSSGGSTYGLGTSGQMLMSNGTNVYWGSPDNGSIGTLNSQYVRIWSLSPGIYKWTYSGNKYIYYNGSSSTNSFYMSGSTSGALYLVVNAYSSSYKNWYVIYCTSSSIASTYIYYGTTSSSSGSYSSRQLNSLLTAGNAKTYENRIYISNPSICCNSSFNYGGDMTTTDFSSLGYYLNSSLGATSVDTALPASGWVNSSPICGIYGLYDSGEDAWKTVIVYRNSNGSGNLEYVIGSTGLMYGGLSMTAVPRYILTT